MSLLKSTGIIILILLLLAGMASASLTAPTTYSIGYKIWGKYWDMMGENGIRNGTIGGVGNNVTFLDGSGVTFLPISGTASDLDMNGKNITNFGLNMSNQTTCRGNMTCTYNVNGSVSLDAVSNTTAIFNRVLNSSTVTAGVYANGSVELTATVATTTTRNGSVFWTVNQTSIEYPYGINYSRHLDTDLSTYTLVDPNGKITVNSTRITVIGETTGASKLHRKIAATNDFNILFELNITRFDTSALMGVYVGDSVNNFQSGDLPAMSNAVGFTYNNINTVVLNEWINGIHNAGSTISLSQNVTYFGIFSRTGTVLKMELFNDAARTNNVANSPQTLSVSSNPYSNFVIAANDVDYPAYKNYYLNFIETTNTLTATSTNNNTLNRSLNRRYTNPQNKTLILQVTGRVQPGAGGTALFWCNADNTTAPVTNISGKVGILLGVSTEEETTQLTCYVPPSQNYVVNSTGTVTLQDWRELFI